MSEIHKTYEQTPGMQVHEADDGLIVFDPGTDRIHHLNYTAGVVYEFCNTTHTQPELAKKVATLYSLDAPPVEDVDQCLSQMVSDGLLQSKDA
ncbi:MAG: PqqD family protein [Hyphomicrobiaceae bacterium]